MMRGKNCLNGEAADVEKDRLKKERVQEDMEMHEENIYEKFYDDSTCRRSWRFYEYFVHFIVHFGVRCSKFQFVVNNHHHRDHVMQLWRM